MVLGGDMAQSLTCDRKITDSIPDRSSVRMFISRVNFLCWLLFQYPFHPCGYGSCTQKTSAILPQMQVAGYS